MSSINFKEITKELETLKNYKEIHSILVYGSQIKNTSHKRSDIDICVVAPKLNNTKQYSQLLGKIWGKINSSKYDVRLFEELPLYIKISIINNHKVLFSRELSELKYYFYMTRKLWQDQSINWIEKKDLRAS